MPSETVSSPPWRMPSSSPMTHATPGAKTETLAREVLAWGKAVYTLADPANAANAALTALGARPLPAHAAREWAAAFAQLS